MGEEYHDVYIPSNVCHDKKIKQISKILYGELLYYCDEKGKVFKDFKFLADLFDKNWHTIARGFKDLEKHDYILIIRDENLIVDKLKSLNLHGIGIGETACEWCGINTFVTDKHHYPIPKEKGGKKTVELCPTCHMNFHYLPNIMQIKNLEVVQYVKEQYRLHGERRMSIDNKS